MVDDVDPCWTKRHEFVNWGVNAGGCFDCGVTVEHHSVEACRTLCAADPECLSFEIATEREREYHGFSCCLEYTHSGKKGAPNLWLGPDDVDGKRCENRVRGWTTYQFSTRIDGVPCDHAEPGYTALNTAYAYTGVCGEKIDVANEAKDQPGRQKWLDDGCPPPNPHLWNFLMFLAFLVAFSWAFVACESSVLWRVKYPVRKKRLCCWVIVYYLLASALLWHLVIAPAVYWHEFAYLMGLVGCCIGLVCGCACSALCTADAVYRAIYLNVPAPAGEGDPEAASQEILARCDGPAPAWWPNVGETGAPEPKAPQPEPETEPARAEVSGVREQSFGLLSPGTAAALSGALAVETRRAAAAEAVAGEVVTGEVPSEPVHAGEVVPRMDLADWQRSWGT